MTDHILSGIKAFRRLDERVATAGQPSRAELATVAQAGYEVVINLHVSPDLPDEEEVVRGLGMEYVQIHVPWEHPERSHLERFFAAMDARREQRLFVHCAANKRVSAFVALYRIHKLGWPVDAAMAHAKPSTFPPVWQAFMEEMSAISLDA
jgi:protein tyrosine phosphatase (PTP) superfamily phosphohydrolase (DUF442 family)